MESQPSDFSADKAADGSEFSDGNTGSSLPLTLVVSGDVAGGRGEGEGVQVEVEDSTSVLSALGLQGTAAMSATAQFYIEQLPNGQARLQTADGQTIEVDVDPSVVGLVESGSDGSSGMPVLLRLADDGTLLPDLSVAPTVQPTSSARSQQVQATVANTVLAGEENGDAFPPGMYIEVHKETEDASDSLGGSTGPSGVGTAIAIVTPEGDESDQEGEGQDPLAEAGQMVTEIGVDRLEDFMDVVTTYRCKFCRFSCAWKSGLMSHFRSCHVPPTGSTSTTTTKMAAPMPRRLHQAQAPASTPARQQPQPERITPDLPPVSSTVTTTMASSASKDKLGEVLQTVEEDLVDEPAAVVSLEDQAEERQIFICGQCSRGFETLEECKDHMVQSHEVRTEEEDESKKPSPGATRKRNQPSSIPSSGGQENTEQTAASHLAAIQAGYNDNDPSETTDDATEGEVSPRRKVHAPKALEEDYLMQPVRKKRSKRDGAAERLYRCQQRCGERSCGYRFRTEEKLEYHVRCHAPLPSSTMGDNRPFRCVECGERSDHWRGLAMHLWRTHRIDLDLHSCTHCSYKTFSLFKLDNHMRIHSEERDFTCDQCGKGFKQLSQLRNHHVVHLDRKNMTHKRWYSEQTCDLCQRTFSDSKCLRKHQQAVHNKVKPYVCTVCGHMSARKAMLQLHLRQHTGEKPFACNACDYRTGDHNSLRRHKMRHSGTKPYKCPHCPYACIQAISYKTHMKNKHPGLEGLYACSLCNFRSVSKENFVNHMSDHKNGILAPATTTADGQSTQLPEGTLQQQLEGLLPGNLSAAQLIYSCLSALKQQQEGGSAVTQLPPGVTSYSAGDGTHTITIQVPPSDLEQSLLVDQDQFFLTVQQQEDGGLSYLGTAGDGSASTTGDTYGGEDATVVATLKIGDVHSAVTS